MKRTPMVRKTPLRAKPTDGKPSPKPVKCKAPGCGKFFVRFKMEQKACSIPCSIIVGRITAAKQAERVAREDRKQTKEKLESLKSISRLESDCRDIVQKIARIRDRFDGCISCHMGPDYRGQWHGSHYRAHGACSSLQFHLWNIHKSCAQCNLYKGGNKEGYIAGLLAKPGYGRERLEWLDSQPKSKRFDREYLMRFKKVMGKRMRRMERRARAAANDPMMQVAA